MLEGYRELPRPPRRDHPERGSPQPRRQKPRMVPDKFDGSEDWRAYLTHFEHCAAINEWSERDQADWLAASLKGDARMVLTNMGAMVLRSFQAMKERLAARFDPEGRAELYRVQLRARRQKPKETLVFLAQEIRVLVDRAYGTLSEDAKRSLAKDAFLDAIADPDLRMRVLQKRPQTIDEALQDALELEAISRAEKERQTAPKAAPVPPNPPKVHRVTDPSCEASVRAAKPEGRAPLEVEALKSLADVVGAIRDELRQQQSALDALRREREEGERAMRDELARALTAASSGDPGARPFARPFARPIWQPDAGARPFVRPPPPPAPRMAEQGPFDGSQAVRGLYPCSLRT